MVTKLIQFATLLNQTKVVHSIQIITGLWLITSYVFSPLQRPDSFEFGGYLLAGYRLNAGQTLYKDWHFMYGPLVAYWASIVVKTGWSLPALARLYFLPEAIGTSIGLYIALRVSRLNLLSSFLILLGSISFFAVGTRWCGALLVFVLFSYSVVEQRKVLSYLAGLVVGVQALYFHDIAVYTGVTLFVLFCVLIATARFDNKALLTLGLNVVAGFVSVATAFFILLLMIGALPNYLDRAWIFTAKYYDTFEFSDPPRFFSIVEAQSSNKYDKFVLPLLVRWISGTLSFYILPIVGAFGVVFYITKIRIAEPVSTELVVKLALSVIAIILFRIVFKTGDTTKVIVNLFPAVLLSFTLARDAVRTKLQAVALVFAVCVVSMTIYPYVRYSMKVRDGISAIEAKISSDMQTDRGNLVTYLSTMASRGKSFVVLPNDTLLYIDLHQINPVSFDYFDPIVSPRYDIELADELRKQRPFLVVVDSSVIFWNKWKFGDNFGLQSYASIVDNYHQVKAFGSYLVYERNK